MLNPGPHHQAAERKSEKAKGKRKMEYMDVSTSEEEDKSGGEDEQREEEEDAFGLVERGNKTALRDETEGSPPPKITSPLVKYGPPRAGASKGHSNRAAHIPSRNESNIVEPKADDPRLRNSKMPKPAKTATSKKRKLDADPAPPAKKSGKSMETVAVEEPVAVSNANLALKEGRPCAD
jgi:hypothetical protein